MYELHLIVYGKVQGVWYRNSAKQEAGKYNLFGWTKNLPEGTVEIIAQGDKLNLEKFLDWCQKGPSYADVKKIDSSWREIDKLGYDSFKIIY